EEVEEEEEEEGAKEELTEELGEQEKEEQDEMWEKGGAAEDAKREEVEGELKGKFNEVLQAMSLDVKRDRGRLRSLPNIGTESHPLHLHCLMVKLDKDIEFEQEELDAFIKVAPSLHTLKIESGKRHFTCISCPLLQCLAVNDWQGDVFFPVTIMCPNLTNLFLHTSAPGAYMIPVLQVHYPKLKVLHLLPGGCLTLTVPSGDVSLCHYHAGCSWTYYNLFASVPLDNIVSLHLRDCIVFEGALCQILAHHLQSLEVLSLDIEEIYPTDSPLSMEEVHLIRERREGKECGSDQDGTSTNRYKIRGCVSDYSFYNIDHIATAHKPPSPAAPPLSSTVSSFSSTSLASQSEAIITDSTSSRSITAPHATSSAPATTITKILENRSARFAKPLGLQKLKSLTLRSGLVRLLAKHMERGTPTSTSYPSKIAESHIERAVNDVWTNIFYSCPNLDMIDFQLHPHDIHCKGCETGNCSEEQLRKEEEEWARELAAVLSAFLKSSTNLRRVELEIFESGGTVDYHCMFNELKAIFPFVHIQVSVSMTTAHDEGGSSDSDIPASSGSEE
ncbi:hypothetical protein CBR_g84745, partial [Chara braunii]